jgi:hypothetical protein
VRLLAAWDAGTGGEPVPFAERLAVMPIAAPAADSAARGEPRDP